MTTRCVVTHVREVKAAPIAGVCAVARSFGKAVFDGHSHASAASQRIRLFHKRLVIRGASNPHSRNHHTCLECALILAACFLRWVGNHPQHLAGWGRFIFRHAAFDQYAAGRRRDIDRHVARQ